jgi:voltage-gated potassium channel
MARVALHPQVGGAVQMADFRLEEIEVPASCEGVGMTVEEVRGDTVIVAVRRVDGRLEPQPEPQSRIEAGDMLVAIGPPPALERLETVFQPLAVSSS